MRATRLFANRAFCDGCGFGVDFEAKKVFLGADWWKARIEAAMGDLDFEVCWKADLDSCGNLVARRAGPWRTVIVNDIVLSEISARC